MPHLFIFFWFSCIHVFINETRLFVRGIVGYANKQKDKNQHYFQGKRQVYACLVTCNWIKYKQANGYIGYCIGRKQPTLLFISRQRQIRHIAQLICKGSLTYQQYLKIYDNYIHQNKTLHVDAQCETMAFICINMMRSDKGVM